MKKIFRKTLLALIALPALLAGKNAIACDPNPIIGSMCVFSGNFAVRNWAFANGQLLSISNNTALFSLLGTTYGGDGRTSFGLPDMRGRVAIGTGQGPGLSSYRSGDKGGSELASLNISTMPSHTHLATTNITNSVEINGEAALNVNNLNGKFGAPNAVRSLSKLNNNYQTVYLAQAPSVEMHPNSIALSLSGAVSSNATTQIGYSGSGMGHENRSPYIVVNWIIALYGTYPSRN